MRPLRVALVGYGFAGRTFHAPLIAAVPGLALVLVGSGDPAKVHADLPGMAVADPLAAATAGGIDLVVVATPNASHAAIARAALEAGRHVVVDKPLAPTLAEARALFATAERAGRLLTVFHNRRHDTDFGAVRAAIESGLVGEVAQFESRFDRFRPAVRDRWRERAVPGGGIWFDLGPHLVDQALLLFGMPDAVSADIAALRDGAQADDWAHVVLRYPRHRVLLHASMLVAGGGARFTVHGRGGSVAKAAMDPQEAQLLAGLRPGDDGFGVDPDPLLHYDGEGGAAHAYPAPRGDQSRFYAALRDALRGGGDAPVPAAQALAVMSVLEAAATAARERRDVVPEAVDE